MSGKRSRTKGHQFERDIAKDFRGLGFDDAKRHLEYQAGEANGVDLSGTGRWRVQCKRYAKYTNPSRIEEIQDSGDGIPLLITKADHKKAIACLYWSDLMKILSDIGEAYEGQQKKGGPSGPSTSTERIEQRGFEIKIERPQKERKEF